LLSKLMRLPGMQQAEMVASTLQKVVEVLSRLARSPPDQ
jgi:hypothetical protein